MIEEFRGKQYRQMSGRRYDYFRQRIPGETEKGELIVNLEAFARLVALCLVDDSGNWLVPIPEVESYVSVILDDWPADELINVGGSDLVSFNNLGAKAEEYIEKN